MRFRLPISLTNGGHFCQVLLALGLLLSASGPQAATTRLQCRSLLQVSPPESDLFVTIERLAELRMQVDLGQSRGQSTLLDSKLKNDYDEKYQELVSRLQSKIPEDVLRSMLVVRIRKKQGEVLSEQKTEKASRQKESSNLGFYTHKENIQFFTKDLQLLKYQPETESLLFTSHSTLMSYSLKDGTTKIIAEKIRDFEVGPGKIISQNFDRQIAIFDSNGNYQRNVDLPSRAKIEISPRAKHLAIHENNKIEILDLHTMEPLPHRFIAWAAPQPKGFWRKLFGPKPPLHADYVIFETKFITDDLLFIEGKNYSKLGEIGFFIFDVKSGLTVSLPFAKNEYKTAFYSEQSQSLIFYGLQGIARIKMTDLENFDSKAVKMSLQEAFPHIAKDGLRDIKISFLSVDDKLLVRTTDQEHLRSSAVYNFENLTVNQIIYTDVNRLNGEFLTYDPIHSTIFDLSDTQWLPDDTHIMTFQVWKKAQ